MRFKFRDHNIKAIKEYYANLMFCSNTFQWKTQGPLSSLSGSLIEWPLSALDSWPALTTTAANNEQNSESCQALKYATIFTLRTRAITQLQSE